MDFTATIRFDENHVLKVKLTEAGELSASVTDEETGNTVDYNCSTEAV